MKRYVLIGIGFAVGWAVFRTLFGALFGTAPFGGSPRDDLIRDSAHEFGSSTGG